MAEIDIKKDRERSGVLMERTGFRLSWGAILAGFIIATALQMVLSILGLAIGLVSFDPAQGDPLSTLGIGVALWFTVTAVISLFIGGMTTGRLAGILTRGDGRLHGIVMWSLSSLLALYFASQGAGWVLGGVFDVATRTASAVAGGAAGAVGQVAATAVDGEIDFARLQGEIESVLNETGNPAIQPDSLQQQMEAVQGQAAGSSSNQALAEEITDRFRETAGQVDRQDLINVIMARTGMSQAEAERTATRVESAGVSARQQVSSTLQEVQQQAGQTAEEAMNAASNAAWLTLLVMGLSLLAAMFGAGRTAPE